MIILFERGIVTAFPNEATKGVQGMNYQNNHKK